jgi:flagellar biosynthesis/type III secretory pathway M-ring protein FliF/YscJ
MLPILVLLILGLFVVKAISRALPKPEPATALAAASPGSGSMTYNVSGGGHSGTSPGQRQAIAGAVGAEGEETTAADHDPDVAEALQRFHSAPEGEEDVALEDIHEKVDVPLEQIKKLSKQRPETVAMLLKGWMMDDRR